MFNELVALLFFSRDYAHRAHLRTTDHAVHLALDTFYKELPDLIDTLVEASQGKYGLVDIPYLDPVKAAGPDPIQASLDPLTILTQHHSILEGVKTEALGTDSVLLTIMDEILHLYSTTLYKLRFLK